MYGPKNRDRVHTSMRSKPCRRPWRALTGQHLVPVLSDKEWQASVEGEKELQKRRGRRQAGRRHLGRPPSPAVVRHGVARGSKELQGARLLRPAAMV